MRGHAGRTTICPFTSGGGRLPLATARLTDENLARSGAALSFATRNVPCAGPACRAGDVREELAGKTFESVVDVAVCDGERLLGLVPLERLVAAGGETQLQEIMDDPSPIIGRSFDREIAASHVARRGARSVAVVDDEGRFLGLAPPERVLAVLWEEHEEDMARLGGFLASTSRARAASEEPVRRRLWHRLPWLALGLAGAMLSAGIVASFEDELRTQVLLAFFVPAVVYMADAVGTQTETVVIRGISVGVAVRDILARELLTGLAIGLLIAAVFLPFSIAVWNDARVAAAVSLALFVSSSIATLVAMALPYTLNRLGRDPAYGSGPLATVIQDILSIVVYFTVASAIAV
jgi:magnesium transporter